MPNIPEKRKNPFEKTLTQMREEQTKKETAPKEEAAPKAPAKPKAAPKPKEEKKETKATAKKPAAKKPAAKKTTKAAPKKPAKVKIDAKTGVARVVESKSKAKTSTAKKATTKKTTTTKATITKKPATTRRVAKPKEVVETPIVEEVVQVEQTPVETTPIIVETPVVEIEPVVEVAPQVEEVAVPAKKPRKISKRAQLLKEQKAAERAAAKAAKLVPVVIVRPEPKKLKLATKEEKAQFKKLEDSFDYLVNLASVVEEKTMNKDEIPDITLGELHVIQMVKKFNNKPMTLIANNLKVTVGSLITCLNRLIQKDYIIRTRDEMDNRVILLSITPKAQKVLKAHDKFHDDILGLLLENGVTLAQATKVLSTLNTVLEVYYDPIHNSFTKEEKGSKAKKK